MATVTATLVADDRRVVVTIAGLPTLPVNPLDPWPAGPWTLYRTDGLTESVVRGAIEQPLRSSGTAVVTDREYPRSRQFLYQLRYIDALTGSVVVSSEWVVPPVETLARVSNPVTGTGVDLTVVQWPERAFSSRSVALDVDGRTDPYVLTSPMRAPVSEVVLRTLTAGEWRSLERLLRRGAVVQLRPSAAAVDDVYLSVLDYRQARLTRRAEDARRVHTVSVVEVGMPAPDVEAPGSTLADLHAAFPGTLADIDAAFTFLWEIAAAPL